MSKSRKSIIFFIIVILLLFLYINRNFLSGMLTNVNDFLRKITNKELYIKTEEYLDAKEYYDNNAEIVAMYDAKTSNKLQTEKQIMEDVKNRGFLDQPIYSDYSIDGEYLEEVEVNNSKEKHPSYQTTYVSSNGELWSIIVINGSVMANPVSFNLESGLNVQLVISESEIITCYDGPTNMFFDTIPDESVLIVKTVERIDVETLDILTIEVLKSYETE